VVAQRLAHAKPELSRRGRSRLNVQNEFRRSRSCSGLRALAFKQNSSNAQLEIRASNVGQDGIVHAPYISEV
jgi:hypothetical protein